MIMRAIRQCADAIHWASEESPTLVLLGLAYLLAVLVMVALLLGGLSSGDCQAVAAPFADPVAAVLRLLRPGCEP